MAKIEELKALAADLRKRLRQVDRLTGRSSERDRDARRKRESRAASKEVLIPACADPERRSRLESIVLPRTGGSPLRWARRDSKPLER